MHYVLLDMLADKCFLRSKVSYLEKVLLSALGCGLIVLSLNGTCQWRQPKGFVRGATDQEWRPEQKSVWKYLKEKLSFFMGKEAV